MSISTSFYGLIKVYLDINDMQQFTDQRVLICGGGDSAVDWSLMLEPITDRISLVHCRYKFRALEKNVENLKASNVDILTPFVPKQLIGDYEKINEVVLEEIKGNTEKTVEVDSVIVNYGFFSSRGPIN